MTAYRGFKKVINYGLKGLNCLERVQEGDQLGFEGTYNVAENDDVEEGGNPPLVRSFIEVLVREEGGDLWSARANSTPPWPPSTSRNARFGIRRQWKEPTFDYEVHGELSVLNDLS